MRSWMYLVGLAIMASAGIAWSMEGSSELLGKQIFESTALGTTGGSCASCHPNGKGLQEIDSYTEEQLREMLNFCIRDALKGKQLAAGSQELEALYNYVRQFAKKP